MTIAQRALAAFPGGISNGEFGLPLQALLAIRRGEGARLWDTDGKAYLDFSIGWGSALVGHACPEVVAAVVAQAPLGSNFAYLNEHALALAEEIRRVCPAAAHLRFCASGTAATMYCARLARAFKDRPKLLKFKGAYHGANEAGVTSLFPSRNLPYPQPEHTSAGTPSVGAELLVAPYNDPCVDRGNPARASREPCRRHHGAAAALHAAEPGRTSPACCAEPAASSSRYLQPRDWRPLARPHRRGHPNATTRQRAMVLVANLGRLSVPQNWLSAA